MTDTQARRYRREDVVAFRRTGETFGGLSNMAPGYPVMIGDRRVATVEALYQACRFPHLPDVQEMILAQGSPMTAKMRAKPFRSRSRGDWDDARVPIMKWCLRAKLAWNWRRFGALLEETGTRAIVEDSRRDPFWGAVPQEDGTLEGRNVLGRLLMQLREHYRDDPDSLRSVKPLRLPDFMLLEMPIGIVGPVGKARGEWDRAEAGALL
ncbi:NADAR family protein [Sphingomonas sp. Leaf412]|uniref:NADAR family protein n=1 Tax=Sphingomonas sp. Leaf412 TaxID=1736370 RepID=UPI0009E9C526|nr:NADAR family protein [Sphingomonas sp. Leaf412]